MSRRFNSLLLGTATLLFAITACMGDANTMDSTAMGDSAASGTMAMDSTGSAMVDPNTATRDQLVAVSGMTADAADSLIAHRPYDNMVDVNAVLTKQLDSAQVETVYASLWRPLDLNTAADAEILLIPGLGNRMLHEFKEYRPYRNIEQFQREIGKYVDDAEVARFQKYVTIR